MCMSQNTQAGGHRLYGKTVLQLKQRCLEFPWKHLKYFPYCLTGRSAVIKVSGSDLRNDGTRLPTGQASIILSLGEGCWIRCALLGHDYGRDRICSLSASAVETIHCRPSYRQVWSRDHFLADGTEMEGVLKEGHIHPSFFPLFCWLEYRYDDVVKFQQPLCAMRKPWEENLEALEAEKRKVLTPRSS